MYIEQHDVAVLVSLLPGQTLQKVASPEIAERQLGHSINVLLDTRAHVSWGHVGAQHD